MLLYKKQPVITSFPKHLAIIGQIHEAPINWQLRHWETLSNQYNFELTTAYGYELEDYINESLLNEAQRKAQAADLAILCVSTETDRLSLPQHQLIRSVALVQSSIWVAVWSTTSLAMSWASKAKAILQITNICSEQDLVVAIKTHTI